ncbi:MAG: peptidase T [Calditrichaeota bacterium]|nr:peptidase T [Calditrichota bacterium]
MADIEFTCTDRFLHYTTFDTQSSEESETFPSTEKQKELAKVLVQELLDMGVQDAAMDENGYVMATLPANTDKTVPVVGLIAHMDTSPDVTGKDVKAQIHKNYDGGDIVLPGDSSVVIKADENPALAQQIGNDIITSDGTTLLGADNKAGIAEIFDAINHLVKHPEIKHGTIKIAVTPDEEIGKGADKFDIKKFAADYAYTIDGETLGEIEDETFCADSVTMTITGVNVHPGYAKNKLVNAIKIATEIIEQLPKDSLSPETTEKREGYVHPHQFNGNVEEAVIKFLIRDFTVDGLNEKETYLKKLADKVLAEHPKASLDFKVDEYYRNMKYKIDQDPKVVEYALEAVRRAGIEPVKNIIRGGTDGARLSYDGLLTPNVFTGGHNFHSKQEWISIQDMQKAVEVIVNLVQVWVEKS